VDKAFEIAQSQLSAPTNSRSKCTSLFDLFSRLASDGAAAVNFILTDGVESCAPPHHISSPQRSVTYLILLRTKGSSFSSGSEEFAARARILSRYVPWIKIVPYWALTSSTSHDACSSAVAKLDGWPLK
jgi:hypothetical protein